MAATTLFQDPQTNLTYESLLSLRRDEVKAAVGRFSAYLKTPKNEAAVHEEVLVDTDMSLNVTSAFLKRSTQAQLFISDFNHFSRFNSMFPYCLSCQKEVSGENGMFTMVMQMSFRDALTACFPAKGTHRAKFSAKMLSQLGQDFLTRFLQMDTSAAIRTCDFKQTNLQVCCKCVSTGLPKQNGLKSSGQKIESQPAPNLSKKISISPPQTAFESDCIEVFSRSALGLAVKDATVLESLSLACP